MRKRSKRRMQYDRLVRAARENFGLEQRLCAACGLLGCDCHEIARGAARRLAVGDRRAWLWLCRRCHEEMGDYTQWPISRQCALKLISDPGYFCLETICELRGRAATDVTLVDVAQWLALREQ